MRLHAHSSHPDYHPMAHVVDVFLNDVRLPDCLHADEEAGTVERYILPSTETRTDRGVVRIELNDKARELLRTFPR